MSLKAQIDAYNVQKDAKLPADVLALMNTTNEELIAQHIKDNALQIGQKVENFSLANHNGENIELADLLKKGPIIISFYRGGWCPYCNLELKALNDYLPQFKTQSAQLIAISPQLPDETLSTAQKNDLEFDVLCDVSNKVAEQLVCCLHLMSVFKRYIHNLVLILNTTTAIKALNYRYRPPM